MNLLRYNAAKTALSQLFNLSPDQLAQFTQESSALAKRIIEMQRPMAAAKHPVQLLEELLSYAGTIKPEFRDLGESLVGKRKMFSFEVSINY